MTVDTLEENSVDSVVCDPPYGLKFMGKAWDGGEIAFQADTWCKVLRVLKPGGHLLAFGGTRTYHRMTCAIEDAGFNVRDMISWVYGTGFPKSHNVGRGIDAVREWEGWGTALKPAVEPICLARKPLSESTVAGNVQRWGTGAINVDGCRVGTSKRVPGSLSRAENAIYGKGLGGYCQDGSESGHGPNIGRFPANLIHDGSPEVLAAFPETAAASDHLRNNGPFDSVAKGHENQKTTFGHKDDGGSAARFFYCAKAGKTERHGSKHPTVKPLALMRWLVRLVTSPGGTVLDPFAGTGTTGHAAVLEGFNAILCEREEEYLDDIRRRFQS